MRLLHYSAAPLTVVHSCPATEGLDQSKPSGLWVSVEGDDDWQEWCETEQFSIERLRHVTEIILAEHANVLRIDTAAGLVEFHRRYRCTPSWCDSPLAIRWDEVASNYDGIIIAPYQHSLRLDGEMRWYYGWDCASGCIWNAAAVARVQQTIKTRAREG